MEPGLRGKGRGISSQYQLHCLLTHHIKSVCYTNNSGIHSCVVSALLWTSCNVRCPERPLASTRSQNASPPPHELLLPAALAQRRGRWSMWDRCCAARGQAGGNAMPDGGQRPSRCTSAATSSQQVTRTACCPPRSINRTSPSKYDQWQSPDAPPALTVSMAVSGVPKQDSPQVIRRPAPHPRRRFRSPHQANPDWHRLVNFRHSSCYLTWTPTASRKAEPNAPTFR